MWVLMMGVVRRSCLERKRSSCSRRCIRLYCRMECIVGRDWERSYGRRGARRAGSLGARDRAAWIRQLGVRCCWLVCGWLNRGVQSGDCSCDASRARLVRRNLLVDHGRRGYGVHTTVAASPCLVSKSLTQRCWLRPSWRRFFMREFYDAQASVEAHGISPQELCVVYCTGFPALRGKRTTRGLPYMTSLC